jgi:hypothetical protein
MAGIDGWANGELPDVTHGLPTGVGYSHAHQRRNAR